MRSLRTKLTCCAAVEPSEILLKSNWTPMKLPVFFAPVLVFGWLMSCYLPSVAQAPMSAKKLLKIQAKYTKFTKKGDNAKQAGSFKKAVKFYTKAINIKPRDPSWALTRRAMTYQEMKNYEAAIADFTKLIEFNKKPASAYAYRAKAKADGNDLKGAIEDINQAIKMTKVPLTYYLARAEYKAADNDFDGALNDCQLALDIQPTDPGSYYTRGNIKVKFNKKGEACEDFFRAEEFGSQEAGKMIALYCKDFQEKVDVKSIPQATCAVDGSTNDWTGIPVFMTGASRRSNKANASDTCEFDVKQIKFAQDGKYLYALIEFASPLDNCFGKKCLSRDLVTMFIDSDNNRETGGEEVSYQLSGFEYRLTVGTRIRGAEAENRTAMMQKTDACSVYTSVSLDAFNDDKRTQRDPFDNLIPLTEYNSPYIRYANNLIELKVPIEKIKFPKGEDKSFRMIYTEWENEGRSPFPTYYYGKL